MAAVLTVVAAGIAGTAAAAVNSKQDVTLNLVAYSTPRPVVDKLIAEFKKTPQGNGDQRAGLVWAVVGSGPGGRERLAC